MPGKRTKYTKRKTYKPYKLAPRVKKIITSMEEKKHIVTNISDANTIQAVPLTNTWRIFNLMCTWREDLAAEQTGIIQGTSAEQRVGERIHVMKNEFVIRIIPTTVTGVSTQGGSTCRIIVFFDREPHNAAPGVTQIVNTNNFLATQNLTTKPRFQIIKDFVHVMVPLTQNAGAVASSGPQFLQKITINKKYTTHYVGAGGKTAETLKNGLFIMAVTDGAACCSFTVQNQITFTDA